MKRLALTALVVVVACVIFAQVRQRVGGDSASLSALAATPRSVLANPANGSTPVPVLVELFTSEGCSSCPPADALLTKLQNEQSVPGVEIIALEEHVDYWDDLGWHDPFSSSEFTARQRRYAGTLRNGNPYTPQMVVDGQFEFVGIRSDEARKTIAAAASGPHAEITVARNPSSNEQEWNIAVQRLPASRDTAEVWVAVTETRLHSNVGGGENAGRDLGHAAVVRQLTKLGVADARNERAFFGSAKIAVHPDWKKENLQIVAFVQEKNSRHVLGANSAKLVE